MRVEVRAAGETDQPTIRNLLQLYLHDFSECDGNSVDAEGLFQYPRLSQYWEDHDRHAFLITVDGVVAGFALVKKGSELARDMEAMDVAEFFVLRGWRRKGVGTSAFRELVRRFPGNWLVRVQDPNTGALAFWNRTILDLVHSATSRETVNDGERVWSVFRFAIPNVTADEQSG